MNQNIISNFSERPRTKNTWRALGLGMIAFLIVPTLGVLTSTLRPLIDPESVNPDNQGILGGGGFASAVISLLLSIAAILAGYQALRAGERSWVVWAGLLLALLVSGFWVYTILGELFFPR